MNRTVALKVLPRRLALNEIYVKNFMRETKLAAQLTHENIVYVLDAGQSAGLLYIAMEFIEGESLHSVVQRSGPLDEKQALAVTWSLAQALSHAHKTGILHRDVKPANVMMQDGKVPKLCDFGMAKSIARSAMMKVSAIMGTPSYMSPEQILGERPDERTDIYGLGATLYTMATGKLPFPEVQTYQELYDCHIRRSVTTLRDANPMVSAKIEWIVLKMMKRKREKRFQSADEVSDAFLEIARRN
jgi:serine/threonine-protein kinase